MTHMHNQHWLYVAHSEKERRLIGEAPTPKKAPDAQPGSHEELKKVLSLMKEHGPEDYDALKNVIEKHLEDEKITKSELADMKIGVVEWYISAKEDADVKDELPDSISALLQSIPDQENYAGFAKDIGLVDADTVDSIYLAKLKAEKQLREQDKEMQREANEALNEALEKEANRATGSVLNEAWKLRPGVPPKRTYIMGDYAKYVEIDLGTAQGMRPGEKVVFIDPKTGEKVADGEVSLVGEGDFEGQSVVMVGKQYEGLKYKEAGFQVVKMSVYEKQQAREATKDLLPIINEAETKAAEGWTRLESGSLDQEYFWSADKGGPLYRRQVNAGGDALQVEAFDAATGKWGAVSTDDLPDVIKPLGLISDAERTMTTEELQRQYLALVDQSNINQRLYENSAASLSAKIDLALEEVKQYEKNLRLFNREDRDVKRWYNEMQVRIFGLKKNLAKWEQQQRKLDQNRERYMAKNKESIEEAIERQTPILTEAEKLATDNWTILSTGEEGYEYGYKNGEHYRRSLVDEPGNASATLKMEKYDEGIGKWVDIPLQENPFPPKTIKGKDKELIGNEEKNNYYVGLKRKMSQNDAIFQSEKYTAQQKLDTATVERAALVELQPWYDPSNAADMSEYQDIEQRIFRLNKIINELNTVDTASMKKNKEGTNPNEQEKAKLNEAKDSNARVQRVWSKLENGREDYTYRYSGGTLYARKLNDQNNGYIYAQLDTDGYSDVDTVGMWRSLDEKDVPEDLRMKPGATNAVKTLSTEQWSTLEGSYGEKGEGEIRIRVSWDQGADGAIRTFRIENVGKNLRDALREQLKGKLLGKQLSNEDIQQVTLQTLEEIFPVAVPAPENEEELARKEEIDALKKATSERNPTPPTPERGDAIERMPTSIPDGIGVVEDPEGILGTDEQPEFEYKKGDEKPVKAAAPIATPDPYQQEDLEVDREKEKDAKLPQAEKPKKIKKPLSPADIYDKRMAEKQAEESTPKAEEEKSSPKTKPKKKSAPKKAPRKPKAAPEPIPTGPKLNELREVNGRWQVEMKPGSSISFTIDLGTYDRTLNFDTYRIGSDVKISGPGYEVKRDDVNRNLFYIETEYPFTYSIDGKKMGGSETAKKAESKKEESKKEVPKKKPSNNFEIPEGMQQSPDNPNMYTDGINLGDASGPEREYFQKNYDMYWSQMAVYINPKNGRIGLVDLEGDSGQNDNYNSVANRLNDEVITDILRSERGKKLNETTRGNLKKKLENRLKEIYEESKDAPVKKVEETDPLENEGNAGDEKVNDLERAIRERTEAAKRQQAEELEKRIRERTEKKDQ